jgi:hypothetical protein
MILAAVLTPVAYSGVQTVKNITFTLPGTFYYVNSEFVLNATGSADIQIYNAPTSFYGYAIENMSISISPCPLYQDQSTAQGQAIGQFYGGGVLTVTGDLYEANNSVPIGPMLNTGIILQANMVPSSSETWTLQETFYLSSYVSGIVGLTPDSPGLGGVGGLAAGDNSLIISDMNLGLGFLTPGISEFGTGDYQSADAPVVQISAVIPEPATLLLLSAGCIGLLSRKKNK